MHNDTVKSVLGHFERLNKIAPDHGRFGLAMTYTTDAGDVWPLCIGALPEVEAAFTMFGKPLVEGYNEVTTPENFTHVAIVMEGEITFSAHNDTLLSLIREKGAA